MFRVDCLISFAASLDCSGELDKILAEIFAEMVKDKNSIIDSLVMVPVHAPKEIDFERMLTQVEGGIEATSADAGKWVVMQTGDGEYAYGTVGALRAFTKTWLHVFETDVDYTADL